VKLTNQENLTPDTWLSEQLGKPAFILEKNFSQFSQGQLLESKAFVSAKVAAGDHRSLSFLQQRGFRIVDVNLQYMGIPNQQQSSLSSEQIRPAVKEDEQQVCKIAATEFSHSRFHQDPEISDKITATIKHDWVANYFCGSRGDLLIVAEHNKEVAGFLLLLWKFPVMTVDLIAVTTIHQNQGVAGRLIRFAWDHHRQEAVRMLAGTQLSNPLSMALYSRLGFQLISANYVLHLHV